MTTQNLDLNKMGLAPMTAMEMQETDGGNIIGLAVNLFLFGVNVAYDLGKSCCDYDNSSK